MGLTYDGITYRSLEEQVRYDAEQVQLLKQADVTINENLQTVNENLQTVNNELNGKLTKPTNPSEESAVTMLANGAVGTKPLSEIGGGGGGNGKLYMHKIYFSIDNGKNGNFIFYSTKSTGYSSISSLPTMDIIGYINYPESRGVVQYSNINPEPTLSASGVVFDSGTNEYKYIAGLIIIPSSISDIVIEL